MNLIEKLSSAAGFKRLRGKDSSAVKNAFFANYLAALMMVKLKDIQGLGLVNDHAHKNLQNFSGSMSDLCFWGRALFYPEDKNVKAALQYGHAELLAKEANRILDSRVRKIIAFVMGPPEQANWTEIIASLFLLKHRFSVQSSYYSRVLGALMKWDQLTVASKDKAVYDSFMYLLQSDNRSNLISRMRELTGKSALSGIAHATDKLTGILRIPEPRNGIFEDDGGDGGSISVGNIASGTGGSPLTGNSIIDQVTAADSLIPNVYQFTGLAKTKAKSKYEKIRKRPRTFKLIKFKSPSTARK